MINYIKCDVTTIEKGIVVHGVNCQGVMGSGVALAIRNKWPKVFTEYQRQCNGYVYTRPLLLGTVQYVKVADDVYVGNWFTQQYYGSDGGRYADPQAVYQCLFNSGEFLTVQCQENERPLYMPRIGCGLGGLDWDEDLVPILDDFQKQFRFVDINVCDL